MRAACRKSSRFPACSPCSPQRVSKSIRSLVSTKSRRWLRLCARETISKCPTTAQPREWLCRGSWRHYRDGRLPSPATVQTVEERLPGCASWLDHPLWKTTRPDLDTVESVHRLLASVRADITEVLFETNKQDTHRFSELIARGINGPRSASLR